jgi:hypothetical protein
LKQRMIKVLIKKLPLNEKIFLTRVHFPLISNITQCVDFLNHEPTTRIAA